jgi:hypothetical protein
VLASWPKFEHGGSIPTVQDRLGKISRSKTWATRHRGGGANMSMRFSRKDSRHLLCLVGALFVR